ncbi:DUF6569 family protein [Segetibacter sp.]|uniref:ARPP-1 family domain-containing protein n=1 Tax=Segetibacter sp. TaxID=2231182 RepID=UPI002619CAFF|nr:DUF6569 family protein [Segetibacter sp.]MCW3082309.1 hypothetical protein [Segetibacter sp.]
MTSFLKCISSGWLCSEFDFTRTSTIICRHIYHIGAISIMLFISSNTVIAQLTYKELRVEYDSAWTFKNLQIVPVRYKEGAGVPGTALPTGTPPMQLSEALLKHKIKLQEMQFEKGADVNWLQVTNHSKQDVVIQSGEILDGGKQDRMVAETKIITPGSTDFVNVFCVEKRRWENKPKEFKTAGVANSELQKTMNIKRRQSAVWKEIDRQFAISNKKSETVSYVDLAPHTAIDDSDYMRYFLNKYSFTDSNFAGYIFLTGSRILSTELFATAELTSISFRNMLSSNIQTARANGAPPKVPKIKVTTFMDKILINEEDQKAYVSSHGKLQISSGKVIHLIAYDD